MDRTHAVVILDDNDTYGSVDGAKVVFASSATMEMVEHNPGLEAKLLQLHGDSIPLERIVALWFAFEGMQELEEESDSFITDEWLACYDYCVGIWMEGRRS